MSNISASDTIFSRGLPEDFPIAFSLLSIFSQSEKLTGCAPLSVQEFRCIQDKHTYVSLQAHHRGMQHTQAHIICTQHAHKHTQMPMLCVNLDIYSMYGKTRRQPNKALCMVQGTFEFMYNLLMGAMLFHRQMAYWKKGVLTEFIVTHICSHLTVYPEKLAQE